MENKKNLMKLGDIPKGDLFKVPERYFDDLPLAIQTKMAKQTAPSVVPVWQLALKYALPIVIFVVGFLFWFHQPQKSPEQLLAMVGEHAIVEYLQMSDMTYEDIMDGVENNSLELVWDEIHLLDQLDLDVTEDLLELYGI